MATKYGTLLNDNIMGTPDDDYLYGMPHYRFPPMPSPDHPPLPDGDDHLYGGAGNDHLYGGTGNDYLYGNEGNDYLYGQDGNDEIWGGTGVDQLWGGSGADAFCFDRADTGDIYDNQADTIHDFSAEDKIYLGGSGGATVPVPYRDAGNTSIPGENQYGIWRHGSDWVVTYNSPHDNGWHDIIVQGGDPHGHVFSF